MKIISVCLAIFLLLLFYTASPIYSHDLTRGGQVNEALLKTVPVRFLPSNPLYFLITAKEAITKFLQPSASKKAEFDSVLAGKRLKEAYLLMEKDDIRLAQKNLDHYAKRLKIMTGEIQKANSQNEDIAQEVDVIVEGFVNQEIFLADIAKHDDENNLDTRAAIDAFGETVIAIDSLKPGIKSRFEILGVRR